MHKTYYYAKKYIFISLRIIRLVCHTFFLIFFFFLEFDVSFFLIAHTYSFSFASGGRRGHVFDAADGRKFTAAPLSISRNRIMLSVGFDTYTRARNIPN